MDLYGTKKSHAENNACFQKLMVRYPWIKLHKPNAEKAPWHIVMTIKGEGPYAEAINIWPHKAKAHSEE